MFGIGFTEILVIALVVIIFIRPEELPGFFRKVGKAVAEIKKTYADVVSVKDEFLREIDSTAEELDFKAIVSGDGEKVDLPALNAPASPEKKEDDTSSKENMSKT